MVLDLKMFPKRGTSLLELYHLQNTITLLGNNRHFSPSASEATGSLAL